MTGIAKEYATALFMLAGEMGAEEPWLAALDTVESLFLDNPAYVEFLASPGIPKAERTEALDKAFSGHIPEHVVSFVQILCERGHIRTFSECVEEYRALYQAAKAMMPARVTSAVPLTEAEQVRLIEKLETISGKTVFAEWAVDASLLGGVVVEMDGKVLDGSLRHRLQDMKDVMDR
ncbi:MAG: ATP synthase F1 subunit delta [Clostridia bacterium]|nr:ATP synthase F1 subunit delta [Clostridia bacterium]